MNQVNDIARVLTAYYHHDELIVHEFLMENMETVMEKLRTDPNRVTPWAHDVISLEEQWSSPSYQPETR